jgi:hypothetical protein
MTNSRAGGGDEKLPTAAPLLAPGKTLQEEVAAADDEEYSWEYECLGGATADLGAAASTKQQSVQGWWWWCRGAAAAAVLCNFDRAAAWSI